MMKTKCGEEINPDDFPYFGQFGDYVRKNIDSEWGKYKERETTKKRGGFTWRLVNCRPVRRDEVTFYEDRKDEQELNALERRLRELKEQEDEPSLLDLCKELKEMAQ